MNDPRYPIGPFAFGGPATGADRAAWLDDLTALPAQLRAAVAGLGEAQLETPYREGGWTVRQVVHHVADSHINSYVRFRLALTETAPTIKPYDEAAWADLSDAKTLPPEVSLTLLEVLHGRWVSLLRALPAADWGRTFVHPETSGELSLERNLALYAWHGRHHSAHITSLRDREGW